MTKPNGQADVEEQRLHLVVPDGAVRSADREGVLLVGAVAVNEARHLNIGAAPLLALYILLLACHRLPVAQPPPASTNEQGVGRKQE